MDLSKYPMKIRILMSLKEDGEQWTTDLTEKVIEAGGKNPNKRLRKSVRSYLVEMDMKGYVRPTDVRPVDRDYYKVDNLVESKYVITEGGLELLEKVI